MTPDPLPPHNTPDGPPQVATGNRFAETHYEADDGQKVRVSHLVKPQAPLERHEATLGAERPDKPGAPMEDVAVDASGSSVWDARPERKDALKDVPSQGERQSAARPSAEASPLAEPEEEADRHAPPFPPAELVSKRAGG